MMPTLAYHIPVAVDPTCSQARALVGGDVARTIRDGCQQLLRMVARAPADSMAAAIRLSYQPTSEPAEMQNRLNVELLLGGFEEDAVQSVGTFVTNSPLNELYRLEPIEPTQPTISGVTAVCDIHRTIGTTPPNVMPDMNDLAPAEYYNARPLIPQATPSIDLLDQILNGVAAPVLIDIAASSTNPTQLPVAIRNQIESFRQVNDGHGVMRELADREVGYWAGTDGMPTVETLTPLRQHDPAAHHAERMAEDCLSSLEGLMVAFHARVFARDAVTARAVGAALAETAFGEGSCDLTVYGQDDSFFAQATAVSTEPCVKPYPVHERVLGRGSTVQYAALATLASTAAASELSGLFITPIAVSSSPRCVRRHTDPPAAVGDDIVVGQDAHLTLPEPVCTAKSKTRRGLPRGIPIKVLSQGVGVYGRQGLRKTSLLNIIKRQLFALGIPLLTIEAAKTDHRAFIRLFDDTDPITAACARSLQVWTLGHESVSPFRFNPGQPVSGLSVDEHADRLREDIAAAVPLAGPMYNVLGEALEEWLLDSTPDWPALMADVASAVATVMRRRGYGADSTKDITAATGGRVQGMTRGGIGRVFQCRTSVPEMAALLGGHALVELDRLADDEACVAVLCLLTRIRMHLRTDPHVGSTPRLAIIIDEAHRIVGARTDAGPDPDVADPKARVAALFERMLVELRSLGVAVIISDQHPTRVAAGVLQSTATTICFGQGSMQDCQAIAAATGMLPDQAAQLPTFGPGDAFLFTQGWQRAVQIRTGEPPGLGRDTGMSDDELRTIIRNEPWWVAAAEARTTCELLQLHDHISAFERGRERIVERSVEERRILTSARAVPDTGVRTQMLRRAVRRLHRNRRRLRDAFRTLCRGPYRVLMPDDATAVLVSADTQWDRLALRTWYEEGVVRGVRDTDGAIQSLIAMFQRAIAKGACNDQKA